MDLITYNLLRRNGACISVLRAFRKEWPNGAPVTLSNALKALDNGYPLDWATCLMTDDARAAYGKARGTLLHAYMADTDALSAAYAEGIIPSWNEARAAAWVTAILAS